MVLILHPFDLLARRSVRRLHRDVGGPGLHKAQACAAATPQEISHRTISLEQALTAAGLVASGAGLLCLLAFGLGWSPPSDLLELWLAMVVCGSPLGVWIHRVIKPLFWL